MNAQRISTPPALPSDADQSGENLRKVRIFEAAERLFCRQHYDAVSIRDIAAEAGVNSALVRYYFGAKGDLYRAIFDRRYHLITAQRLSRLAPLSIEPGSLDSLRDLVRAWVEPLLALLEDPGSRNFIVLLARESSDPAHDEHRIFEDYLDPSARVCLDALRKVFPDAKRADLVRAYLWMVACTMSTITAGSREVRLRQDRTKTPMPPKQVAARLELFVAHGLHAMVSAD